MNSKIKTIQVINPAMNAQGGQLVASGPQLERPNQPSVNAGGATCRQRVASCTDSAIIRLINAMN